MPFHHFAAFAIALIAASAAFSAAADSSDTHEQLLPTPPQFHGPFYPTALPRDTDNDLVIINETGTPANGEIVHLTGRILDLDGKPVANALVELWQSDANGVYVHHDSPNRSDYDRHFQGFGRLLTGPSGEYYFRTVKPASHVEKRSRRAPHFHLGVFVEDRSTLFTQVYFENDKFNERDPILNSVGTPVQRDALIVPLEQTGPNDLTAVFDVVLRYQQDE